LNFKYIDYGKDLIKEAVSLDEAAVYVFNSHPTLIEAQRYYNKNRELFSRDSLFLMKEELWDKLFFTDKTVIKEDKVNLIFYGLLNEDDRNYFGIDNYSESTETAFEFRSFYDFKKKNQLDISEFDFKVKWQQQRLEKFEEIRKRYIEKLAENELVDRNLKKDFDNFNIQYIKELKSINFVNILSFNEFDKKIKAKLQELGKSINIILQLKEEDFDESELRLQSLTFPDDKSEINIYPSREKIVEVVNMLDGVEAEAEKSEIIDLNGEDNSLRNILSPELIKFEGLDSFTESSIYSFLDELFKNLVKLKMSGKGSRLDLNQLLKSVYNRTFRNYYNLQSGDINKLKHFSNQEYVYLDRENISKAAGEKINQIVDDLVDLKKLTSIDELLEFIKSLSLNKLQDDRYENRDLEQLYDSLMELKTISLLDIDQNLNRDEAKTEQIFKLTLNYLAFKNIKLYSDDDNLRAAVKSLEQAPYIKRKKIIFSGAEQNNIPKDYLSPAFLTEADLKRLGLELNENSYLKQKYSFFSHIFNAEKSRIFYIENVEQNQTSSPFVEELKLRYGIEEEKPSYTEDSEKEILTKIFRADRPHNYSQLFADELIESDQMLLEDDDFYDRRLSMSHYRFRDLKRCPFKFYMNNIAAVEAEKLEIDKKLSRLMIGSIAHKFFEDVIEKYGIPLKDCSRSELRDILEEKLLQFDLQIHDYFKKYYHDILFENLLESLHILEKELNKRIEKIKKVEAEFNLGRRDFYESEDGIKVYISGRPDLLIEAEDETSYIVDLKTGSGSMEQLALYSLMLNFDDRDFSSTSKAIYNVLENKLDIDYRSREDKLEKAILVKLEELFEEGIYKTIYKSDCRKCDYYDLCGVVVK